jgi:hypothetical protein
MAALAVDARHRRSQVVQLDTEEAAAEVHSI